MSIEINSSYSPYQTASSAQISSPQIKTAQENEVRENANDSAKAAEKCTTNTDRPDREIEKLKEKKQQLEQQIRQASKDNRKVRELERKLAQTERELNLKESDAYRRQNSTVDIRL